MFKMGESLYLAKLFFINEKEIKTFPDKQQLRAFHITRPALQEMLKRVLQVKVKKRFKLVT